MKVLAINGSPHKEGGTFEALQLAGAELKKRAIDLEIVHVGTQAVHGCKACGFCRSSGKCVFNDDPVNACLELAKECDGLIIASPVHYAGIAGAMKCFLDRFFYSGSGYLRHKVGASVVSVRRAGGVSTFDQLNHYLFLAEMVITPSLYWTVLHGTNKEEAAQDAEGVQMLQTLGKNMAWLLESLAHSADSVKRPEEVGKRVRTNFIR